MSGPTSLVATTLSILIAAVFAFLGLAKLAAVQPMRERATHVGFGIPAYRRLGALELTGAVGLLTGLALPVIGLAAAIGFLLLLTGAVVAHVRAGDNVKAMIPALVVGVATLICLVLLAIEVVS